MSEQRVDLAAERAASKRRVEEQSSEDMRLPLERLAHEKLHGRGFRQQDRPRHRRGPTKRSPGAE